MTLNDLERRNDRVACVISPNSVAFVANYVRGGGHVLRCYYAATAAAVNAIAESGSVCLSIHLSVTLVSHS